MKQVGNAQTLAALQARLAQLREDSDRKFGTMSPGEMLCHLGDANEMVLGQRPTEGGGPLKKRPRYIKWLALYTNLRWPSGRPTHPRANPRADGTRPAEFECDRARVARD